MFLGDFWCTLFLLRFTPRYKVYCGNVVESKHGHPIRGFRLFCCITANPRGVVGGCGDGRWTLSDNDPGAIARNEHCCVQKHSSGGERILSGSNESKVKKRPRKYGQCSTLKQPCRGQTGTRRYHLPFYTHTHNRRHTLDLAQKRSDLIADGFSGSESPIAGHR